MGQIQLDCPVPRENQDEILRHLYWVDAGLVAVEFDPGDARVLRFREQAGVEPDSLGLRLKQAADHLSRSVKLLPGDVCYTNSGVRPPGAPAPYQQLLERGWVRPVADGAHAYSGLMCELLLALDAQFRRQALALGTQEYAFPSMIDLRSLARTGYLENFPHQVNFLCHLPEQLESVQRFRAKVRATKQDCVVPLSDSVSSPPCALCPTVCFHFYNFNEGQTLSEELIGATAISPCFRYEGRQTGGLRRLREFTMREIVFIGTAEEIRVRRVKLMDCMKGMLELCALESRIRSASDPFFVDDYERKRLFQIGFDLKYEAQAFLPDDDDWLAVGSINHHHDYFGKAMSIKTPAGDGAHSCCLGFGLDRWCMAVFAQYGLDPRLWPGGLRALLAAHRESRPAQAITEGVG